MGPSLAKCAIPGSKFLANNTANRPVRITARSGNGPRIQERWVSGDGSGATGGLVGADRGRWLGLLMGGPNRVFPARAGQGYFASGLGAGGPGSPQKVCSVWRWGGSLLVFKDDDRQPNLACRLCPNGVRRRLS